MDTKNVFDLIPVFGLITDESVSELTMAILERLPAYWWTVPASSSGKYHPEFSLGVGGLRRHSMAVARMAYDIAVSEGLSDHECQLLAAAGLLHDGMKQGDNAGHTVHEHPVLMASFIRENFEGEDAEFLAHVIESHMGKWNTSEHSEVVLPRPSDVYQRILSYADMIASRKYIHVDVE